MACNMEPRPETWRDSLLHAMITRHKPNRTVTTCRFRRESAPKPTPYRIKSQHCGRHTTWGEPTPMLSAVAQAALEGDLVGKVQALATDPKDGLAAALARLGRAFMAKTT
jgi:hypothetical protein